MNVHQLRREQSVHAASHLNALYHACARRYVDAANLLEIGGTVIGEISQSLYQAIDLAPLLPVFWRACERYNDEIYSPQAELWGREQNDAFMQWSRYFHHHFVPAFVSENRTVRDVLRAMRKLPCDDPRLACEALVAEAVNMAVPTLLPGVLRADLPNFLQADPLR